MAESVVNFEMGRRRPHTSLKNWCSLLVSWTLQFPRQFCFLVATASVILSCYPIVFFGKSFLSPNNSPATHLLYGRMPTVPGYDDTTNDDEVGADFGASMWYSWPTSVVESRALLRDHELPLWNRFDCTGVTLLGQGQSMFGDPLHILILLTNGSAAAWDLKYILAKLLFAFSVGLCVLTATKHLPAATIIAASSPFIGFFCYRYNHPAFFSFCYAPLILLCWLKFVEAPRGPRTAFWLGAMAVANWMVLNSGTVKEAYVLLLAMNLCGLLCLLFTPSAGDKSVKLLQVLFLQAMFVLIATPIWLTFLRTLKKSWTASSAGGVWQLQPSLFIGLFDDIFYRQFNASETNLDPSANFLTLVAVIWFFVSCGTADKKNVARALSITCILALATVFGIVPPRLIVRLPFLRNILHIDNTFSCVAIVCLLVLAGFGIEAFWRDCRAADFKKLYLRMAVVLVLLLAVYAGTAQAGQHSTISLFKAGEHLAPSHFFWGYSSVLVTVALLTPLLGRTVVLAKRFRPWHILSTLALFTLLHWRYGMHLRTPFDRYVMNPHQRVSLIAESSAALRLIKSRSAEPSRTAGVDPSFFPGYGGAVGIEQIDGADPLANSHYRDLMNAAGIKLLFRIWRYEISPERLVADLPLFNMLNLRYILAPATTPLAQVPELKNIASLDLNIYESEHVWPRAFFTNRLFRYEREEQLIEQLKRRGGAPFAAVAKDDLKDEASVNELLNSATSPSSGQYVAATDYRLTTNRTSFNVKVPGPGVIVLTEAYVSHDFRVHVNGKPAHYFRVNSAFRGILAPGAGDYTVSFVYWPRFFTLLLVMAGAGIAILVCWLVVLSRSSLAPCAPIASKHVMTMRPAIEQTRIDLKD